MPSFAIAAQADEGPPAQQHSPEACREDPQCLNLWFAEYKEGLIQELLFWRMFENDVADRNGLKAEDDLKLAIEKRQYKHNHWDFYKGRDFKGSANASLRP